MRKHETVTEFKGKKLLNATHKGEEPKTEFKNSYDSPRVKLINYTPHVYEDMFWFIMGSFGNEVNKRKQFNPTPEEIEQTIEACLNGEALPLAMEIPKFTFAISGIDRIITHQIVRSRIGVVYSQHCTGDNDVRHLKFLLPHRIMEAKRRQNPTVDDAEAWLVDFKERIQAWLRAGKLLYAEGIDKHEMSIQDMRHIIPHCMDTYIYMSCNYMMLRNWIGRRLCTNETPQMQRLAVLIRDEVSAVYPLLGNYLRGACDITKRCHFKKNNSIFGGAVCYPCDKYPHVGDSDPKAFIHPMIAAKIRGRKSEAETEDESVL